VPERGDGAGRGLAFVREGRPPVLRKDERRIDSLEPVRRLHRRLTRSEAPPHLARRARPKRRRDRSSRSIARAALCPGRP
jgi:hypothetical protein